MKALRSTMSKLSVPPRRSAHTATGRHLCASSAVRKMTLVGGTHGNELPGIYLVKSYQKNPHVTTDTSLRIQYILSNVAAVKQNTRYVDTDLNRCFTISDLEEKREVNNAEQRRARELDDLLGPKSHTLAPKEDLIIDLHNTTANTGVLLCFHESDAFSLEIAAHLYSHNNSIRAAFWPQGDQPFLPTLARSGMTVEIGPVSHSTVNTSAMRQARKVVGEVIQYVKLHNAFVGREQSGRETKEVVLPMAQRVAHVPFPRDGASGEIVGFVHPNLQGISELQVGSVLRSGDPILSDAEGAEILFDPSQYGLTEQDVEDGIYPMFVNEAAYYEKDIAFYLTKLVKRTVCILSEDRAVGAAKL